MCDTPVFGLVTLPEDVIVSAWRSKQLQQMTMVLSSNAGKIQMIEQLLLSDPQTQRRGF